MLSVLIKSHIGRKTKGNTIEKKGPARRRYGKILIRRVMDFTGMLKPRLREWPIVVLLALFGVLYSVALDSYGMFQWDEAEYASIARSVAQGKGYVLSGVPNDTRPPLLPLTGAASMRLFGEQFDDSVLRVTGCVFALLALLGIYGFAAAAFDRMTGLVAAVLLGISPFFWTFVPLFMCEIPFLAFFSSAVWFFYFGTYLKDRFFIGSWLCWGLAFLTRYTAVLFLPVLILFIPIALWLGGPAARRRLSSSTFFLSPLAALLVLAPWLIRQYVTFGSVFAGLAWISRQLQVYVPSTSMPWYFYFRDLPAMLSPVIAGLFLAGLLWAVWRRNRFALHNVLVAALILVWFSCYRYKEDRLVSAALPFLAVVAAVPLRNITKRLRPLAPALVLVPLLAALSVMNFRTTRAVFQHSIILGYPSFLDAMIFLREHASSGAVVLGANYPQIYWYSGLHAKDFPEESGLPDALRHSEWAVITNFERGQKSYVFRLAERLAGGSHFGGTAAVFQDRRYVTLVIRSDRLLALLVPAGGAPRNR